MGEFVTRFVWLAVLACLLVAVAVTHDQMLLPPAETPRNESPSEGSKVSAVPGTFSAKVVNVYDGDTLTVKRRGKPEEKLRLAGIDAPELNQRYGAESRDTLIKLLGDDPIQVRCLGRDRYGRGIAIVTVGKANMNEKMVLSGAAWFYADYANGADYSIDQLRAYQTKKGLWAETGNIPPWLYRKLDSVGSFGHAAIEGGLYLDKGGVLHNSRCTSIVSSRHRWNGIDRYTNCTRCGGAIFD